MVWVIQLPCFIFLLMLLFKALLFLGAGAVIHYVHSNEMKDMGGLRKFLPITHITFLIACLAIAGVPPFAGFFSKEEILLAAYQSNNNNLLDCIDSLLAYCFLYVPFILFYFLE